jgi:uncharacterized protein (UPF0332 family)
MTENKIIWCAKKQQGIRIVEPNDNLSKNYIADSNKTLNALENAEENWKLIMGYYACYNAFNSILMKAGIECKIHDCTIELISLFPEFDEEDYKFMKGLKNDRIKVQYYLEPIVFKEKEVKEFILKCKQIKEDNQFGTIRNKIINLMKGDKN